MRIARSLGVRSQLLGAMVLVAVASVAVTALLVNRAVDSELRELSARDLRISAANAAETAAAGYIGDGGWSARSVRALRTVSRAHGEAIAVLGAGGRPVAGSPPVRTVGRPERAAIVVRGRIVGTVVAAPPAEGGLDGAVRRLDQRLQRRMSGLLMAAGLLAGSVALALALLVALRLARPLRRLTDVARRMGAGEIETRAAGAGGGREIARLANTLDRLAATLRRQDEVRRATVSDVTHELRGALVGVVARVEALRTGIADDPPAMLAQIDGDVSRLHRLVDDVGSLSEAQRPALLVRRRPIALDEIVAACAERYADRCAALSIALTQRLAPVRVDGDPERLGQVVDNLLSNALRYTDSGGRIAVTLRVAGGEAAIDVADSGIGIAPEYLARIFDRFWRAPEARARASQGSGVGLALVAALVAVHDGQVEVASRPGCGSTFTVRLPLSEPGAAQAPRRRVLPSAGVAGAAPSAAARAALGLEAELGGALVRYAPAGAAEPARPPLRP
jgi:two-component system, OmpR family, sensor histidine kinase BaeS